MKIDILYIEKYDHKIGFVHGTNRHVRTVIVVNEFLRGSSIAELADRLQLPIDVIEDAIRWQISNERRK